MWFTGDLQWTRGIDILHYNPEHSLSKIQSTGNAYIPPVENDQLERQRTVHRACKKNPPDIFFNMTILVDNQRPVGICLIHKAGSTTMKYLMLLTRGLTNAAHSRTPNFLQRYDFHQENITSFVQHLPYKTFMFVRNPISRLISSYKAKFLGPNGPALSKVVEDIIETFRPNSTHTSFKSGPVTFQEFVKYVISWPKEKLYKMNVHWKPQYLECNPCQVKFDFIGKLETIRNDANLVLKTFYGIPVNHIPHHNKKGIPNPDLSLPEADILHCWSCMNGISCILDTPWYGPINEATAQLSAFQGSSG